MTGVSIQDVLATASVAADTAPLADDLSDFEILDGWPSSCMLCVCARVCVSICMYFVYQDIYRGFGVCVCVCLSLSLYKDMYMYIYVCVYVCICICICLCLRMCICVCIFMSI